MIAQLTFDDNWNVVAINDQLKQIDMTTMIEQWRVRGGSLAAG